MNNRNVLYLDKEKWKGYKVPIHFASNEEYVLNKDSMTDSFSLSLKKVQRDTVIESNYEDDQLYQGHWDNPRAFGVFESEVLIGVIEVVDENWNNRLRISELWVSDDYQSKGIGTLLIQKAIEIANEHQQRAIVLEAQSSNTKAIDFYLNRGFSLIGFDRIHYSNQDEKDNMVRVELGLIIT